MPLSELSTIAKKLRKGQPSKSVTTREFLSWFDAQRRGPNIVADIREQLAEVGIFTEPDFQSTWIDGQIEFKLVSELMGEFSSDDEISTISVDISSAEEIVQHTSTWISRDATYRISKLKAANQAIVAIDQNDKLDKAILLMMEGGYSQLPVMNSEFNVKGMITWRSIGCALGLGKTVGSVRDFMESHHEIRSDFSIFDAITTIVIQDYVLVRGQNNKITGIITASDLSLQFRLMTEPFLLLSEIENLIRNLIGEIFSLEEMACSRDQEVNQRKLESVKDLSFGEYIRLIQEPERWKRLTLALDRVDFCKKLDEIRQIRNGVMHFDPDGIAESDLTKLRNFTNLLKQIERYR